MGYSLEIAKMMSIFPWQPSGATSPKSGGVLPLLLLTTGSLVDVDVGTSPELEVVVVVVVVVVAVLDEVEVVMLVVSTSLLALPNGMASGTAVWQPTK
ncbi:hypothetical protein OV090_15700 [Nannocystis sp. RBIL2]|uniref:hypothetical protein n=1 Tax=Nannocystis sp. RBIL2 TaxID=2996788 RepID=UPI0022708E68|nr:hypothetical protein [Nannocystis sp. RBIL2]MCY1066224.1 hypothetical protein [Nannocystis sp. RBIL2]